MIQEHIERWKEALRQEMDVEPEAYLEQLFSETNFLPAIERWTPNELEEVKGIAEGSGVGFKYIMARQLSDEEPWYRFEKRIQAKDRPIESCSAIGASGQAARGKRNILAQNMDTPTYYDGHQVLLHIKDPASPVEALVFTVAGKISLAGLNNQGIGICCNTLVQLNFATNGLPEDFLVRGFLARATLGDGLAFVRGVKHASGQNYVLGGPERVLDLECSANKICEFVPYPEADRVYHTNHPLVNDDQSLHERRIAQMPHKMHEKFQDSLTTYARFESLEKHLGNPGDTVSVDKARAALSSHDGPVCRHKETGASITLGCLIMELMPSPTLHLAPGPPCSTPFTTYTFDAEAT
jgi:hypothetical protein